MAEGALEPPGAADLGATGRVGGTLALIGIWALPQKSLSVSNSYRSPSMFSSRNFSILVFRWISLSINFFANSSSD